jgi:cytochrome c oxidase subunit III
MSEAIPSHPHAADQPQGDHHFQTIEESLELNQLGVWLFLVSEIMFFGALFAGYTVYRMNYPTAFAESSQHLDLVLGTINTAILLTSSLTMALAVHAAQHDRRQLTAILLVTTALLGLAFLGIKGFEYFEKIQEGYFPGGQVLHVTMAERPTLLFYSLYFITTGLHAVHLFLGVLALLALAGLAWFRRIPGRNFIPVEMLGLYWHFVDLVWIFLFPLLYLIERS